MRCKAFAFAPFFIAKFVQTMKSKISLKSIVLKNLSSSKLLVAVSGGLDSLVLCDLLMKSHQNFAIAHCNFQLRGKESDADEDFVSNYCKENRIEFFSKKFEVKKQKGSGNFSTQMAARDLRYNWFFELMETHHFDYLLTAHHLNDSLETFLINLSRGSGIHGLAGIQEHTQILRPLLPYSKNEILAYANGNHLKWREDSSNAETDYVRNKIRHHIIPVLEEIHPQFLENFSKSIQFLKDEDKLISHHLEEVKSRIFQYNGESIHISIDELEKLHPIETYLHHLFSEFGFKNSTEIQKVMQSENGEIRSKTHRFIRNRNEIILTPQNSLKIDEEILLNQDEILEKPLYLRFLKSEERNLEANEVLDYDTIQFPLRLRKMKTADVFFPFGMKGSKKLSKFFKDELYSKLEKENTWLLVDNEDRIVYVVGKRIDDRFKITKHTHKYLNIFL